MLDRSKFMEMLQSITEVAKVQGNRLTKEEIAEYFSEMELEEAHFQHIYHKKICLNKNKSVHSTLLHLNF